MKYNYTDLLATYICNLNHILDKECKERKL